MLCQGCGLVLLEKFFSGKQVESSALQRAAMGDGSAWGGRLTCNQDIQVGSNPTFSTMS